ncbi:hypothetical protein BKA60DRAFT_670522 [Fusarium oxysporum]|nr:hypothetical protein BKA60DRAFT_670522 [Fusarium oxysporum]
MHSLSIPPPDLTKLCSGFKLGSTDLSFRISYLKWESLSGIAFHKQALEQGHTVTAYGRSESKLPVDILQHPNHTFIKGELDDEEALKKAFECSASVLVSFLGPSGGPHNGSPVTNCYKYLLPLLIQKKIDRALVLCTPAWRAPGDKPSEFWDTTVSQIRKHNANYVEEMLGVGGFVSSLAVEDLKWTIFRVPFLSDGEILPVHEGIVEDANKRQHLTRQSMANWVLKEMTQDAWVGQSPVLSN